MSHPKMTKEDLALVGQTDQWDESKRWKVTDEGCLYRTQRRPDGSLDPLSNYPGDHRYEDSETGEVVVVHTTVDRRWKMPSSVDDIEDLYKLSGVEPREGEKYGWTEIDGTRVWGPFDTLRGAKHGASRKAVSRVVGIVKLGENNTWEHVEWYEIPSAKDGRVR